MPLQEKCVLHKYTDVKICCCSCSLQKKGGGGVEQLHSPQKPVCLLISGSSHLFMLQLHEETEPLFPHLCTPLAVLNSMFSALIPCLAGAEFVLKDWVKTGAA